MELKNVYDYIVTEINNYKTVRVPITDSTDWNMSEYIERCTNVSNGWYHKGKNDGLRPYKDIVTPIINVAKRSEGFDVKDIVPYVDNIDENYKSFLVKKYHPKWARKYELDTFIDEVVTSSIVYDLVLVKNINTVRPELVPLQKIAFCDQTDIMSGPIAVKHQYTPAQLTTYKGKWDADAIDEVILKSIEEKVQPNHNDSKVKTPGKYIEVYELRGYLPKSWLDENASPFEYEHQLHIVSITGVDKDLSSGVTLYKGKDKPLDETFKSLVIEPVFGRACGRSIVETLFEPQVWTNYSAQKIKKLLDAAITVFQSSSDELADQDLTELPANTIIKHEDNKPITKVDGNVQNLPAFTNYQISLENDARVLGSASDAQLGTNPVSGTPFALQSLVVQQGQGIHEFRQGKIATFFADVLYRDWFLKMLVKEMNNGLTFSEELSLEEITDICEKIITNEVEEEISEKILTTGIVPTKQEREALKQVKREEFMKKGNRKFFEVMKDELKDIPMDVYVNIKGKQANMAQNADKLTNLIRTVMQNPTAFSQIPGMSKLFNQLLENSGLSAVDFTPITTAIQAQPSADQPAPQDINQPATTGQPNQ